MYSNRSTDNLLDNLESDLNEVIELDNPVKVDITSEVEIINETKKVQKQPEPSRRVFVETKKKTSNSQQPIAAVRKVNSRDKNEKNDENEIIQLSSVSSNSQSDQKNSSKTILRKNSNNKTQNETVFIDVIEEKEKSKTEISYNSVSKIEPSKREVEVKVEIISEKVTHTSTTSNTQTTSSYEESSSESSTSPSSSEKVVKRRKKRTVDKKKKMSKQKDEDSQVSKGKIDENLTHDIGVFIHSCGPIEFSSILCSGLRIKVSLYNEDTGKMIGDTQVTGVGKFNNDFYNLMCSWNEITKIDEDFEKLKTIHTSVLMFFEVVNLAQTTTIFWAFLKFFTPHFSNINDKFQLQLFQYQKIPRKSRFLNFKRNRNSNEITVFDQWQSMERRQIHGGILTVTVKILNRKIDEKLENPREIEKAKSLAYENLNRKWQKLPGQACKIPNKIFKRIFFREKGSMNVKFNHEGNLIAFSEVTSRDGSILHILKFPEMQEIFTMLEHSDLIHDIDWWKSKLGTWMVTASSDFTAIVWRLEESSYTYKILPHPSFVYAAKFLQEEESLSVMKVVTAGRDNIVRIWQSKKIGSEAFELIQELNHPDSTKFSFITSISTRNSEIFYTSHSMGEIIEWTKNINDKKYQLNRRFQLDEFKQNFISDMEIHPRGNKLFVRLLDYKNNENCEKIYIVGIPTATLTQKFQQPICNHLKDGVQGRLKISPCGSHIFTTNGRDIRHYSITSGSLTSSSNNNNCETNFLNFRMPTLSNKITCMDYHPKDFYFAFSIYGVNGGIVIMNYEVEGSEKDLFERFKVDSKSRDLFVTTKQLPTSFTEIIRRLDEVFFTPAEENNREQREMNENTFTVDERRSRTYSVSQGPATFTIQPANNRNNIMNNTYEIQKNDKSDDDTTISESLN